MNKSFVLLDKNNNVQRSASIIVKFNFEEKDYLVYSVEENEQNNQIFVSRLVLNSEGKYFIDNILPEEKGKLNNIVYNIVILVPTDAQKGSAFEFLTGNLLDKFSVKLSLDVPEMQVQEYYSNCSVAITSKVLVDAAIKLYNENLNINSKDVSTEVPTWTAPVAVTAPVDANIGAQALVEPTPSVAIPVHDQNVMPNLNLQLNPVVEPVVPVVEASVVAPEAVNTVTTPALVASTATDSVVQSNPQMEKLAVMSDPSLGLGVNQPNVVKNKKAGFANTKYIVIGTVCLVLAVAVVITAYILISNMK